jgi:Eukaryotic initiation factor 4E
MSGLVIGMVLMRAPQTFWQVYNNTPFSTLPLRDSLHLFKKNVKPIWYVAFCPVTGALELTVCCREDPRNKNGGAWTFRVPKANSQEFWKEVQMMAIGEILQEVVERGMQNFSIKNSDRPLTGREKQETIFAGFLSVSVSILTSS